MNSTLTAEQILGAKDFQEKDLEVKEWGGLVRVRSLSMGGRYTISERAARPNGTVDNAIFAAATLEMGVISPKLTREQAERIVAEHPAPAIEAVCGAIWELSGMGVKDAKNG